MPIISILWPLSSYISHAILPFFVLSIPDFFGITSSPLFVSISIPPLPFGCSFMELCIFPVHVLWTCLRLSFFNLVSTRMMKSSFFWLSFLRALFLLLSSPSPFTFKVLTFISDMLCLPFPFGVSLWSTVLCFYLILYWFVCDWVFVLRFFCCVVL